MAAPEFDLYCSGTIDGVNASSADRDVAAGAAGVMSRIDLRGQQLTTAGLRAVLPRGGVDVDAVIPKVRPIVDAVIARGAVAALEYGETFDGVRPDAVRVPAAKLASALAELAPDVRTALEVAIDRTRRVHADQRRSDTTTTLAPGATVTERWVPVERVGLYVPGGNAVYPSSVVMNVVPAQTAGVASLVIASPPQASNPCRTRRSSRRPNCSASTRCGQSVAHRR
jgi:histidinol dehydrogenase